MQQLGWHAGTSWYRLPRGHYIVLLAYDTYRRDRQQDGDFQALLSCRSANAQRNIQSIPLFFSPQKGAFYLFPCP